MTSSPDVEDVINSFVEACHNTIEQMNVMKEKKRYLNDCLKQATECMFSTDYAKAISFYKEVLNLIIDAPNVDEYDLSELDLCTIEYSLYKCYASDDEHFEKAADKFIPLVTSCGKKFPMLHYELAKFCLKQHYYHQAESVINNGLEALANVSQKSSLITYWPGTDIQILESDPDVLLEMLEGLKQECHVPPQPKQDQEEPDSNDDACYESDTSCDCDNEIQEINSLIQQEIQIEPHTSKSFPDQSVESPDQAIDNAFDKDNPLLKQNQTAMGFSSLTGMNFSGVNEAVDSNHGAVLSAQKAKAADDLTKIKILNSTLKADVPEFIPRSGIINSGCDGQFASFESASPATTMSSLTSPSSEMCKSIECLQLHKFSQTTNAKMTEKSTQVKSRNVHSSTQTINSKHKPESQQNKACAEENDHIFNLKQVIFKLTNQQREQQQIEALQEKLRQQLEQTLQAERTHQISQQVSELNNIKLEMQATEMRKSIANLNSKNEEQERVIKVLHSLLMEHYSKCHAHQKQLFANHLSRCQMMIDDLKGVLKYLTSTSIPTVDECGKQICQWETERKSTIEKEKAFDESCENVFADLRSGYFAAFPNLPNLQTPLDMKDILHVSYVPAVNQILKGQHLLRQQNHYYQQYSERYYHYARYQPAIVSHPPVYYEQPQSQMHSSSQDMVDKAIVSVTTPSTSVQMHSSSQDMVDKPIVSVTTSSTTVNNNTDERNLDVPIAHTSTTPESGVHKSPETYKNGEDLRDHARPESSGSSTSFHSITDLIIQEVIDEEETEDASVTQITSSVTEEAPLCGKISSVLPFKIKSVRPTIKTKSDGCFRQQQRQTEADASNGTSASIGDIIEERKKAMAKANMPTSNVDNATSKYSTWRTEKDTLNVNNLKPKEVQANLNTVEDNTKNMEGDYTTIDDLASTCSRTSEGKEDLSESNLPSAVKPKKSSSKFSNLLIYIKNKIPGVSEDDIVTAVRAVREKNSKLTGMSKVSIVAAVKAELNGGTETNSYKAKLLNNDNLDATCVICIEPFGDGEDPITTLQCQHTFHTDCLRQWFSNNSICPICRIHAVVDDDFPPWNAAWF